MIILTFGRGRIRSDDPWRCIDTRPSGQSGRRPDSMRRMNPNRTAGSEPPTRADVARTGIQNGNTYIGRNEKEGMESQSAYLHL